MEYGAEERAALTVHFRPHPACQFCLFGSAGFVYHPSLAWRVRCKAGRARSLCPIATEWSQRDRVQQLHGAFQRLSDRPCGRPGAVGAMQLG